jgi:hypothetical protein
MTNIFFVSLTLLGSILTYAAQQTDAGLLLDQGQHVATSEEASTFKKNCESQKDSFSCYNYAVHLAQTLGDETQAVQYYQLGCDLKYDVSCFNLGGVLIKDVETRAKGVEAFQISCLASKQANISKKDKDVLKVACDLIPILKKHMATPYQELINYIKTVNPPPQNVKKVGIVQKSEPGSEAQKKMNISLDKRLMSLKKTDPKEFKAEMQLQKLFNEAVKNFCSYYEKECEGSVCSMCIDGCYSSLYFYRQTQAEKINSSKFTIETKIGLKSIAQKYFKSFADGLCQLPESIWSKSKQPNQCLTAVLADIQSEVISPMTFSEENEGDVCAQLSN